MATTEIQPAARTPRRGGILLHPTSLPGPFGIGDLGPVAHAWVEALGRARQTWWQVLPLGPTGYGDSPYQCFSAFAGNPYLVSLELLRRDDLLSADDLAGTDFPAERVDYGPVIWFKLAMLARAFERFQSGGGAALRSEFDVFCAAEASWLDDYALFMALKDAHPGITWHGWDPALVRREPTALAAARERFGLEFERHRFQQFLFFRQWHALREHARVHGVRIIGDVPIFVAADSADVWAHPEYFQLDASRQPTVVAGVPPDYFSDTGQLWGNPLYDWDAMLRDGYSWWTARLRASLAMVDLVRVDHFRGFEAYWAVPAGMPTAVEGRWVPGPGPALFETLRAVLGCLPILAEDLGVITPPVEALRARFRLPGMRVLQFAFGGSPEDRFLPHNFDHATVVYTGTHDNDTTRGWFTGLGETEQDFLRRYLGRDGTDIVWDLIRLAWSSVADTAIVPLQDVLELGSEARMNVPARAAGNWTWRALPEQVADPRLARLGELSECYARTPPPAGA